MPKNQEEEVLIPFPFAENQSKFKEFLEHGWLVFGADREFEILYELLGTIRLK